MAIDEYTYGEINGVARRMGWVTGAGKSFTQDTNPTQNEVEIALDDVAAEIHGLLAANGFPIQTRAAITGLSTRLIAWFKNLNEIGASANLLMNFSVSGDPEEGGPRPQVHWRKKWETLSKMISSGAFLENMGLARAQSASRDLASGSYQDEDGYDKLPAFERGMTDYPGSRSLSENPDEEV